jgi:hypothetical protein
MFLQLFALQASPRVHQECLQDRVRYQMPLAA